MDNGLLFTINDNGELVKYEEHFTTVEFKTEEDFNHFNNLLEIGNKATELNTLDEWHEDDSICLWWKFPIEEEPYVGSPLDVNFPNNVTHFTRIIMPKEPSR